MTVLNSIPSSTAICYGKLIIIEEKKFIFPHFSEVFHERELISTYNHVDVVSGFYLNNEVIPD